jgi:hypothetical protein
MGKNKYYYYAVDEFGDRMRKFFGMRSAKFFIKNKPGWTIEKVLYETFDMSKWGEAPF